MSVKKKFKLAFFTALAMYKMTSFDSKQMFCYNEIKNQISRLQTS